MIKPVLYKCPNCNKLYSYFILLSGNTFGAIFYSDGFRIAPMLPNLLLLSKCNVCKTFFKLNNDNLIDEEDISSSEYEEVPKLSIYDYIEYIDLNPRLKIKDELYVRQQIRFEFNHNRKLKKDKFLKSYNVENLLKMIEIYENIGFENNLFTVAELYRNTKQFDKAIELFEKYKLKADKEEEHIIDKLILLAKNSEYEVILI
jgi:hypothetical protein